MSMTCEVFLKWEATPQQHRVLGSALWLWCCRDAGNAGICQYLDSQPLADLLAGIAPRASPSAAGLGLPYVPFLVSGESSRDRETVLESLRQALPAVAVADIRVEGISWHAKESSGLSAPAHSGNQPGRLALKREQAQSEDRWRDDGGQGQ